MVIQVGHALDNAVGVSPEQAFEILNKCAEDQSLCSYYISELAKSPDIRNRLINLLYFFSRNSGSKITSFFNLTFFYR
jgi:hypothetical protein